MPHSSHKFDAAWNYAAVAGEFLGTAALGVVQSAITVRFLSKEDFGQFSYTLTLLGYLLFFSSWSMMFISAKEFAQKRDQSVDLLAAVIQTRLLVSLPLPLAGIGIYFLVPDARPETMAVICIGLVDIFLNCIGGDLGGLFAAFNRQRAAALMGISAACMRLISVAILFFGLHEASQWALGLSIALGSLLSAALGHWLIKKILFKDRLHLFRPRWEEIKRLLRDGGTLLPGRFCVQFYTTFAMVACGWYLSLEDVAVFRVATAYSSLVITAALLTQRITSPQLLFESGKGVITEALKGAVYRHVYYGTLVGFCAVVCSFAFGDVIVGLVYGQRYLSATSPANIMILQIIGLAALNLTSTLLLAQGKNWILTFVWLFGGVAAAALTLVLIPRYAIAGGAAAQLLVNILVPLAALVMLPRAWKWLLVPGLIFPSLGLIAALATYWGGVHYLPKVALAAMALVIFAVIGGQPLLFRHRWVYLPKGA